MIILIIFNFLCHLEDLILTSVFSSAIPVLTNLTSWISSVSVPQTLFDVLSLTAYFLPMGVIQTLFGFTALLIVFKLICAFIHVISVGKLL